MKIVHILNEIKASGAEAMLVSAEKYWTAKGYILSALSTGNDKGDYAEELENVGYTVSHIPKLSFLFLPTLSFATQLFKYFKVNKFDLVHIHPETLNFSYAVIARLALPECKIIRTVHHIFPQPKTFSGQIIRGIRVAQRLFMKKVLGVKFISNSESGLKNEKRTYFSKNILAYNWFDSKKFTARTKNQYKEAREALSIPDNSKLIVSLGGNWTYKNYDKIITAINALPSDVNIIYYQVGPDENNVLASLADSLNDHRIKVCGRVDEPNDYLTAADCYIMPSDLEGFGVAAAEAMGRGLPAILSNRPALKDYESVIDGIIWTEPTVEGIQNSLLSLSTIDHESLFELGTKISTSIHNNYSCKLGAEGYMDIYNQ